MEDHSSTLLILWRICIALSQVIQVIVNYHKTKIHGPGLQYTFGTLSLEMTKVIIMYILYALNCHLLCLN